MAIVFHIDRLDGGLTTCGQIHYGSIQQLKPYTLKRSILIILIIIPIFSYSQQEHPLKNKLESQTVRVIVRFENEKKEDKMEFGMGIVLKGEYLSTCYHLIVPKDSGYKLTSVHAIYNERVLDGAHLYDSTLATSFKANTNQYDFSKHIYNDKDYATDILVLKLSKKLKNIDHSFKTKEPSLLDTVFTRGNLFSGNVLNTLFHSGPFLVYANQNTTTPFYYAFLTSATHGFSGTPLYNNKGEILGMVQWSIEEVPTTLLYTMYVNGQISMNLVSGIEKAYKEGKKIQMAIDFTYLTKKYLSGYI